MAVQLQSITPAMRDRAERLSELVPTLPRGRDKRSGIQYVTFPSSDDPEHTGHNTNGLSCTCPSFSHRGACSHALAVSIYDRRQESARIAAARQLRRENGTCSQRGCLYTAQRPGGRCETHARVLVVVAS